MNKDDHRIISRAGREKSLIIINKIDLPSRLDEAELNRLVDGMKVTRISTLTGEGIDDLLNTIPDKVMEIDPDGSSLSPAPNIRHKNALTKALANFKNAVENIRNGSPAEIIAVDIREGADTLGEITGETPNEEIYDRIFSEFCLGK